MAKNKPIQIQRVGLNFVKHYALTLPFVIAYVLFISTSIIAEADPPERADALLKFGLCFLLIALGRFFGGTHSVFSNPFAQLKQLYDQCAAELGKSMAQRHIEILEEHPDLQIIMPDQDDPKGHKAAQKVTMIQSKGGEAITESDLDWHLWGVFARNMLQLIPLFLAKIGYHAIKHADIIGGAAVVVLFFATPDKIAVLFMALVAFAVPFFILFWRPIKLLLAHAVQEHPWWLDFFYRGIGGPSGRFAGLREFAQRDMSEYFNRLLPKPRKTPSSDIYLGRTPAFEDVRLLGRHVGLKGADTHMLTVARTGAGKSRDALWNTLLNYVGGVICFDPKGEHFRMTAARRGKIYPVYLLDPYGQVEDVQQTHFWNPLDEIDIESDAARDQLTNIAEASIYPEKGDQNAFFQENGAKIFRGFMAHVLTKYPKEEQHLGTVYDLIATGEPEGQFYSQKSFERLLAEMALNPALQGSAREAAGILMKVGDRERGSYLSTLQRGLDWINSPAIRKIITKPSTFSLREAKSREASIYLVLPDDFISAQGRFLRTFYSLAGEVCGDYITKQPEGSKRRVLMIFDEFNALGYFKPAQEIILRKRSAGIKCWFLLQNLSQLQEYFNNTENFMSSCDKQFYGVDQADTYAMEILVKALGQYTEGEGKAGQPLPFERIRNLFEASDIAQWTGDESMGQIVIPAKGKPMKLKRVPFYRNFSPDQYGKQATSA